MKMFYYYYIGDYWLEIYIIDLNEHLQVNITVKTQKQGGGEL